MTNAEQKAAAKQFAADWAGHGDEKQETQAFWMSLLSKVYGIAEPDKWLAFELPVKLSHTSFIDAYIENTHVLIEQKGANINLRSGYKQSDGSILTPFQQARRYAAYLPHHQNPRWIVVCNFREFHIHDMNRPNDDPEVLPLSDLEKEYPRLNFLVNTGDENIKREMEISLQAGEIVGAMYDAILKKYRDPTSPDTLESLNMLCVRLVFCLYAESAGIFAHRRQFHDYLNAHRATDRYVGHDRYALIDLFRVLNQTPEERDPYLTDDLSAFPYVNGGLFAEKEMEIPQLGNEILDLILKEADEQFDWSEISPTIFGALFESTLNQETRRSGGMHYTSIENIHKVIDPLFLNDLRAELDAISAEMIETERRRKLENFRFKLSRLKFLDPACGSGNFLTEAYLSLRRLENRAIALLYQDQVVMNTENPIRVSIEQFYGIEINDFAVKVAKTALWIAENQMLRETEDIVHTQLDFLPLRTSAHIVEGNALRMDWASIAQKDELCYIMGNPPFVGYSIQSKAQKEDLSALSTEIGKNIDYVAGWFFKAADLMNGTNIRTAFVSTNSITQGEQVAGIWKPLFEKYGVHIDFAHQTFRWDSESSIKAHVHCVITGFSVAPNGKPKQLFASDRVQEAENINGYLLNAPTVFVERRTKPLCDVPEIYRGSQPTDDGNFILTEEEKNALIAAEPQAAQFIRPYMMGKDFIDRKPRYCLWLVGANPTALRQCRKIMERVENVRQFRLTSKKAATQAKADMPTLFDEIHDSKSDYVAIPKVSSERRRYIPMDYLKAEVIAGDKLFLMPDATLYHFGVLTSNVHMAWTLRAIEERLQLFQYDCL